MEARLREQSHVIAGAARLRNRACLSGVRVARFTVGSCLHFHPRSSRKSTAQKKGNDDTDTKSSAGKKLGYFPFMQRKSPTIVEPLYHPLWIGNVTRVDRACYRCYNSYDVSSTFYYTSKRRDRSVTSSSKNEYYCFNVNFNVDLGWIRMFDESQCYST